MNQMEIFKNPEFGTIRAVEIDGEPWLVGKDVALALEYKNPQEAIRNHVDAEDKGVSEILTPGGMQKAPHHQRIRPVFPGAVQQTPTSKAVPPVDYV